MLPRDIKALTLSGDYAHDLDGETRSVIGGSATRWAAITPRMAPEDFRTGGLYGYGDDWPLGYEELEPYYCRAEAMLGVSGTDADNPFAPPRTQPYPLPPFELSWSDRLLAERLRRREIVLQWCRPLESRRTTNCSGATSDVRRRCCARAGTSRRPGGGAGRDGRRGGPSARRAGTTTCGSTRSGECYRAAHTRLRQSWIGRIFPRLPAWPEAWDAFDYRGAESEGLRYFCNKMYLYASRLTSPVERLRAYWRIFGIFGYTYSPVRFV